MGKSILPIFIGGINNIGLTTNNEINEIMDVFNTNNPLLSFVFLKIYNQRKKKMIMVFTLMKLEIAKKKIAL